MKWNPRVLVLIVFAIAVVIFCFLISSSSIFSSDSAIEKNVAKNIPAEISSIPVTRETGDRSHLSLENNVEKETPVPKTITPIKESQEEDSIVLEVKVIDSSERPILAGFIECLSDDTGSPEQGWSPPRQTVPIAGVVTPIRIPASHKVAVITASAEGLRPGRAKVGFFSRSVVVTVGAEQEGPWITGSISVDGVRRSPEGLLIQLHGHRPPQFAFVDWIASSYSISAPEETREYLWVGSRETAPVCLPVLWPEGKQNLQIDLDLKSGRTLELHVVDPVSGKGVAGVSLWVAIYVLIYEDKNTSTVKPWAEPVKTDSQGVLLIKGIPEKGHLTVKTGPPYRKRSISTKPEEDDSIELLDMNLDSTLPQKMFHTYLWSKEELKCGKIYGFLRPEFLNLGSVQVCFRPTIAGEKRDTEFAVIHKTISTPDFVWQADIFQSTNYEFWLERDGQRISEILPMYLIGEREGPISFTLLK